MLLPEVLIGSSCEVANRALEALSQHCVWQHMLRVAARIAADAAAGFDEGQRAADSKGDSKETHILEQEPPLS